MQAKNEMEAIKKHEERLNNLESFNIASEESETPYKRYGKRVYMKELQYNIGSSVTYNSNINIANADDIWIDYANSYIDTNIGVRLPLTQYHNENDWNRTYLKSFSKIFLEFGDTYLNYSKIAYIVIFYTKQ